MKLEQTLNIFMIVNIYIFNMKRIDLCKFILYNKANESKYLKCLKEELCKR